MHMHGLVICCSVHIGLAGWVWRFLAGAGVRATPALSPIASTALAPAPPPSAAEPQPFTSTFNGLTVRIIPPADPSKRCAVLEPPRNAWKTLNAPGGSNVCRAGRGCSPRVCRAASGARYMAVAAGPGGARGDAAPNRGGLTVDACCDTRVQMACLSTPTTLTAINWKGAHHARPVSNCALPPGPVLGAGQTAAHGPNHAGRTRTVGSAGPAAPHGTVHVYEDVDDRPDSGGRTVKLSVLEAAHRRRLARLLTV